ncbi:hypothetical protein OAD66_01405 [Bacteroidia bacterium]|nr:hypothetical protein [Bacteroidia bacterium]MDB9881771.1 hypothetical protein [Bacteroidia bacterium]
MTQLTKYILALIILITPLFSEAQATTCTIPTSTITKISGSSLPTGCSGVDTIIVPSTAMLLTKGDVDWSALNVSIKVENEGTLSIDKNTDLELNATSSLVIDNGGTLNNTGGCTENTELRIGLTSFACTDFASITAAGGASFGGALPVELVYFESRLDNQKIVLTWAAASELNND